MEIKKIIRQHRRDIWCLFECKACGNEEEGSGYDDRYFHEKAVPKRTCSRCHKMADPETFVALSPKYSEHETV